MTILTSATAHGLACDSGAFVMPSVICLSKYISGLVLGPSSWSVRTLPQATFQPEGVSLQRILNFPRPTVSVLSILQW